MVWKLQFQIFLNDISKKKIGHACHEKMSSCFSCMHKYCFSLSTLTLYKYSMYNHIHYLWHQITTVQNTTMVLSSIRPACALRKEQYVNIQCALELLYMTIWFNCQQHFNQLWLRIKPWFYNDHSFKLCTFILWLENKQMNNETSYYNGKCTLSSHTQSKLNHGYLSRIEPWFYFLHADQSSYLVLDHFEFLYKEWFEHFGALVEGRVAWIVVATVVEDLGDVFDELTEEQVLARHHLPVHRR